MTEQNEQNKTTKPLTLSTTRTGAASKADATQVRQKFSHGRTRAVTVEVKKPVKRAGTAPAAAATPAPVAPTPAPEPPKPAAAPSAPAGRTLNLRSGGSGAPASAPSRSSGPAPGRSSGPVRPGTSGGRGIVLRTLTEEEKEARARALVDANRDAEIARKRAAEEASRRAIEEEARAKADEEHRKRLAEEEARKKAEEEAKRKADALVQKRLDQASTAAPETPIARQTQEIGARPAPPPAAPAPAAPAAPIRRPAPPPANRPPPRMPVVIKRPAQPTGARREAPKRRNDKVDVGRAVAGENDFRSRSVAQQRRRLERERRQQFGSEPQQKVYREVTIPETITVQDLAARMSERGADVIKTLMRMGVMATINQAIDADTAELVVTEMGHRSKRVTEGDVETGLADVPASRTRR
ncbi:MAG: translation initiation factor IF-2, partial [Reyranella sp.]